MEIKFIKTNKLPESKSIVFLISKDVDLSKYNFSDTELDYINRKIKLDEKHIVINKYTHFVYIQLVESEKEVYKNNESLRKEANKLCKHIKANKIDNITIANLSDDEQSIISFAEGLALSNYDFIKYKNQEKDKKTFLKEINLFCNKLNNKQVEHLQISTDAVYLTRDLINEPVSFLTSVQLAAEAQKIGKRAGFKTDVFNKKKIESLRMGGLLAVNKGSIDPPTFSVLEWKPENAKNSKPIVLVGKGIVYDTGGLSLKPTNYMDTMKSDMSGAAAVIGTFYAIAKAKLPVHVVGLIPATDNRPDGNAYTPGDVITMHNGLTVEVLNTDAEGRMILADALSYAKQYKPELVFDLATLTGAAAVAIGAYGIVAMGTADKKKFNTLKQSGNNVYERIVEFPFWEEYDELLKSDIADLKNIGGRDGGAITAGKFLEHFTDYPYIHLDIAGPAFIQKEDSYRGKGGTGVGVRLFFDYFKSII
ncbi:MAG: leucyl aminopeptidase [Bacteroidales bacterium]|nr:leucyl aminopeptidase [Bacteroidales bacterium]